MRGDRPKMTLWDVPPKNPKSGTSYRSHIVALRRLTPLVIEQYPQKPEKRGCNEITKFDVAQRHRVLWFSLLVENSDHPEITYFDLCTSSALESIYIGQNALCKPSMCASLLETAKTGSWVATEKPKMRSHEVTSRFHFPKWKCEIDIPKNRSYLWGSFRGVPGKHE